MANLKIPTKVVLYKVYFFSISLSYKDIAIHYKQYVGSISRITLNIQSVNWCYDKVI